MGKYKQQPFHYEPNENGAQSTMPKSYYYYPFCYLCKYGDRDDRDFTCYECHQKTPLEVDILCLQTRGE